MVDLADRMVDRLARRPHGLLGRLLYRFPVGHQPGFDLVLARMKPEASDTIAEVGCGGGVFLRQALRSGCRAMALDHSPAMVEATASLNADAVRQKRLEVVQGEAGALPMADASIDKVYCLNAFFFFPEPQAALAEMARVLKPGGTVAIITAPPEWREKIARIFGRMAQAMRFDEAVTLTAWAGEAGLEPVDVVSAPNAGFLFIARKVGDE